MAASLHSESRRMYSWWWDSHISPKNSKWLQENLTDMDTNVKTMIKLIEEDADSFARRAEMYYKKRPELMKLVEEFYRAYRALAERYDHATGALRQAHRTMAEAFPNQIPLVLADEMQSGSSVSDLEPHTPEMPTPIRALFEPEDLQKAGLGVSSHFHAIKRNAAFSEEHDVMSRKGLKQLNEMFATGGAANVKLPEGKVRKGLKFQEEERTSIEPQTLAASKEKIRDSCEKEDVDKGLKNLHEEVMRLAKEIQNLESLIKSESERADKAETEIGTLKETISKLDSEKEAALLQCHASSERISNLETEISRTQDDFKKLNSEMMQAVTKLNAAEQRCLHLEKANQSIKSDFESVEQKAKLYQYELNQKQEELDEVQLSLRTIEKLHFQSKEEVSHLSLGIQSGVEKSREMELSNMSLQEEVHHLKEQNGNLHEETLRCAKKRENLQEEIILLKQTKSKLQKEVEFHVEEKKVLQEEFGLLKKNRDDLEHRHKDLEEKTQEFSLNIEFLNALIKELRDGNAELNEICKKHEEEKVFYLKNLEKLENVTEKNSVLEKSLADANEELEGLRQKISCLEESCESLQGELSDEVSEKAEVLYQLEATSQQMEKLAETNTILQNSLCDVNVELGALRMKMKDLEDSYQSLNDERTNLLSEKATLAYQVETSAWNMDKLLEKNAFLEKILSDKNAELEFQRVNLERLEESSHSLYNEKSSILAENTTLVSRLEAATQNMERLSENNAFLEKSLSEANITLENLGMKLEGLEESWQSLCDEKTKLIAEKNVLVSQLETTSQYSGKLSEKNALLEKSLSDANTNLDYLGEKLKGLEESFRSLYVEKSNLFVENKTLASQVESTSKSLESLENKYSELEEKHSNLAEEKVLICNQLTVLQECLKVEKQENETCMHLCKSQLATLENQIRFFQEEGQLKEEEIEMAQQRNIDSQIESFIMQRCMLDMIEINLNLSGECQKHLEASSCMEKLTLDMKKENHMQKMKLTSLIEHDKKLIGGISLLLKILNIHVNFVSLDDIKDEELLQIILGGTRNLMNSISDSLDEKQHLILEKSVIITVLQQLGLDMDDLITKKGLLELESQIRAKELSVLQSKRDELLEMNGQLRQDLQLGVQRERELKAETDILYEQISYLQEAHRISYSEVCKLVAGSQSLSNKFDHLKAEMFAKEVENNAMLEEAVTLDILSFIFMSLSNERASELKLVHNDMNYLQGLNYDLNQEIGILNQKMELVEAENMRLKESVASLEECRHRLMTLQNDLIRMQDQCEQLNLQIQISDNLLMHKDLELAEANQKIQDARQRSEGEILKLIEEKQALSEEFYDLKKQKDEVDDENSAILAEVITLECLGMFFRNLNDEISLQLKSYGSDVDQLSSLNNDLYKEIRILNEEVQVSAVESMHLKKHAVSLEEDFHISQREISKLSDENNLLSKKLYQIENQRDAVEEKNCFLIAEALTVESLYLYFRSLSAERGSEIQVLIDDLDHLSQTKKGLDENLRVIYEKKEVLKIENMHLKNSVRDLEKELETSRNFSEQLNFQLEDGKSLLTNKDKELSETNQMVQSMREKNSEICRELESLNIDIDEAKMLREELQMNILSLSEGNVNKDNEITRLHEEKNLLEGERLRLHEEVKMLRSKEEHLTSELKKRTYDAEQCEKELAALLSDLQICTVNAALFEEKVFEWIVDCESHLRCAIVKQEMLYEEINVKNASNDELKRTVDNLEGENRGLKDNLNEILTLVTSLWNVMTSLEDETLSLAKFQISKRTEEQDIFLASMAYDGSYEEPKEDHSTSTQQTGVIQLKMLPPKVEKLKKVVLSFKSLLEKERLHSNSWCKEEAVPEDKGNSKICKKNNGQMMKDIQLDQVSSSLLYGGGTCLYRPSKIEISETDDDMLELWETAERDCNKMRPSVANEHDIEYHQIEAVEEVKSEYPSSELMAEKELGIDKLELPKTTTESYEEWKKKVLERLASDAQRLSVLQTGINELKGKMESSEISKTPLCIEYSTVKTQLKEAEGAILQLNDINSKLTRKAEDYSASSSSLTREKEELGKLGRRQLSEHARRGSEKIGNLELELHKIHYIFLKLEEENENRSKAMEKRSSILLRDYIYAKRGTLRKKKGAFCGCMKPKTKG